MELVPETWTVCTFQGVINQVLPVAAKAASFLQLGEKWWYHSAFRGRRSARKSLLRVQ